MPHSCRRLLPMVVLLGLSLSALPSGAKTFVFPHLLEQSGSIGNPNTFDTQIYMTYSAGLAGSDPGGGATVDIHLFDETTGLPVVSNGGSDVCSPCTFELGGPAAAPRKRSIRIDDLIVDAGGFPSQFVSMFAIAVVGGDAENVGLTSAIVNARTGPGDLAVFVFEPQVVVAAAAALPGGGSAIQVVPHFVETPVGTPSFNTEFYVVYSAGIGDIPAGMGADVDVYLFDEVTGNPLVAAGGAAVCAPCSFQMGTGGLGTIAPRKRKISIESLISNAGGFPGAGPVTGWALFVLHGDDPGAVNLTSAITHIRTGPQDIDVSVFEPQPILATSPVAVDGDVMGDVKSLRARPNPSAGSVGLGFSLARASNVSLGVFDVQGRTIAELTLGRLDAGNHSVRWDGRNESGQPVAAGTYFARVSANDGSRVTRLVVLSP